MRNFGGGTGMCDSLLMLCTSARPAKLLASFFSGVFMNPTYYSKNRDRLRALNKKNNAIRRVEKPWRLLLSYARQRANKNGLEFTIDIEWAKAHYTGKCELTGIEFVVSMYETSGPRPFSPSIDRIDNAKGYVPNNCRFVLWVINAMKSSLTDDQLWEVARGLVDNWQR